MKVLLGIATILAPTLALACAPAPPRDMHVDIGDETALVVWDGAAQKETFVRSASFRTSEAKPFGFLVPTPTKPELAEVPQSIFTQLEGATLPDLVFDEGHELDFTPVSLWLFARGHSAAPMVTAVQVLERKEVAGYEAVELAADDPKALAEWLASNGFDQRPALTEWLTPYVAQKWIVTAFKIAAKDTAPSTAAVRMTFSTPRPFFPYREPSDQAAQSMGPRALHLYVVADKRMTATLGGKPLAAETLWADALPAPVPGAAKIDGKWLTKLEDASSPRHGTDELYLEPAPSQDKVRPKEHIADKKIFHIPVDVLALAIAVGYWGYRRSRKR